MKAEASFITALRKVEKTTNNKVMKAETSLHNVEETANNKVMIAVASSSRYLDQQKNLRLRYTDVTASRKQAFNKERDKLKQQHQKEIKLWSKKVSQVESNEYNCVREQKKEVVKLTEANNKMASKLAQVELIYFDQ